MQDSQFIRDWTDVHENFTRGVGRMLERVREARKTRPTRLQAIVTAYDGPIGRIASRQPSTPRAPTLSPAARASLRGLAATVLTVTLWFTVMALATPEPGLTATAATAETCECVAFLALA
jgi:hypothetical protein